MSFQKKWRSLKKKKKKGVIGEHILIGRYLKNDLMHCHFRVACVQVLCIKSRPFTDLQFKLRPYSVCLG